MRILTLYLTAILTISISPILAQTAKFMPTGKAFYIQSAMNYGKNDGGYWDIPGHPKTIEKGSNIQVWTLDDGHDRMFTLLETSEKDYFEIKVGNTANARVDVPGGKSADGTSIKTWDKNGKANQRFMFQHVGGGRFKIFAKSGKVITVNGQKTDNGTNVHLWTDHNGAWLEWYLIDVKTRKPFIPQDPQKGKTQIEMPKIEKPSAIIGYVPEAEGRFGEYKKADTLSTRRIQFKQGYLDVYNSEPYTFNRIISQKPKFDSETYDASGAIVIEETSQWIYWNKQNNPNTGASTKIMFYISANRTPEIKHDTNLGEMPVNLKNKVWSIINSSIKSNPAELQITEISHPQVSYTTLNGYYVAHGVSTAKSDVDLTISTYVIFLQSNEVFEMKVTMANDERRLILEDLVGKMLSSIVFY